MPKLLNLLGQSGHRISPHRWTRWQWLAGAAFAGVVALAWKNKRALQEVVQGNSHTLPGGVADAVAGFVNIAGSGFAMIAWAVIALVAGKHFRKAALVDTVAVFCLAGVWCLTLWSIGRFLLAEHRPIEGGELRFFTLDGHGISGHAAVAALLVLPVRDVLLRRTRPHLRHLVTVSLVAWALIVAWSRVWLGLHYVWNVLSGLALGYAASAAAVAAWREAYPVVNAPEIR